MTTLRARLPVLVIVSLGGALLLLYAVLAALEHRWPDMAVTGAVGLAHGVAALWLAMSGDQPPPWAARFEVETVTYGGSRMRCNRCDSLVFPFARRITLTRLIRYAFLHTVLTCDPARDGDAADVTQRLRRPQLPGKATGR
jgi:hypothetical protein